MSTDKIWRTVTTSSRQTEQLAARIGSSLRGGEVIELRSDLGGGKTTFTRGLARGAGSNDVVGSPSFTLSREYKAPGFTIAHFDFYRLEEAGIVGTELAEMLGNSAYVTVVEWGDIVSGILPKNRVSISIAHVGDDSRELAFLYPEKMGYLLEGVV